jgi:hypothetical protein
MGKVIGIETAITKTVCVGCPAIEEELIPSDARDQCPFYRTYVDHADGGTVEMTHHECHNSRLLGEFVGTGLIEMKSVDPLTGREIHQVDVNVEID